MGSIGFIRAGRGHHYDLRRNYHRVAVPRRRHVAVRNLRPGVGQSLRVVARNRVQHYAVVAALVLAVVVVDAFVVDAVQSRHCVVVRAFVVDYGCQNH